MDIRDEAFEPLEKYIKNSPDSTLTPEEKKKLTEMIKGAKETLRTPLDTDKWIYRCVVGFLGLAILAALSFTFFIFIKTPDPTNLKIPDIFLAIGSAAVGALAGLLAPSPGRGTNQ